jgi:hypothetical protein
MAVYVFLLDMNSDASASRPSLGDGNSNPSAFLSNEGVGLLFGQNTSVVVIPPDFAAAQVPKYSIGSRCRLVPQPCSEWGTIIGQIYAPVFKDLDKARQKKIDQWSWIYLVLLDTDSPSRGWIIADWVDEEDLELLPAVQDLSASDELEAL